MTHFEQPDLAIPTALEHLRSGRVRQAHGLLPWGSNATLLITVTYNGLDVLAVYKPRSGERPLWDFPEGTLCQREVAAFVVSEALGWHLVPATILRDGPHGTGSVQYFMPHDPEQHYFTFEGRFSDQLKRFAAFDIVINNADRKGGHCLLDGDERLWAIDHGICFHYQPKLRTVIWDFAGDPLPGEVHADLEKLCKGLTTGELASLLDPLLSRREIEAMRHRLNLLLEHGTYPATGSGRSYPWPPV